MGQTFHTSVHELARISGQGELGERLNCPQQTNLWKVVRSREVGGERIILDKDFLREDIVPDLTKEAAERSLYEYLENELGLVISFAKRRLLSSRLRKKTKAIWIWPDIRKLS